MDVTCNVKGSISHNSKQLQDGRREEIICLKMLEANPSQEPVITARWSFPLLDIAGRWHPACRFDRSIKADWSYGERTMSAISAPITTFFSEGGKNRGTVAVSETLKEVRMSLGVHEEDGTMKCSIVIHPGKTGKDTYTVRILCDFRDVSYEQSIREAGLWWETSCGLTPAYVPAAAKNPMYSFWYSYHQEFTDSEIEEECRAAKEMGFETIILDDGWQTDDTNRGYGYCGDWKPTEKKIKNMKQHVENVHKLGMKYLLWFSVPYVGMYSQVWEQFCDKMIAVDTEQKAGVLDIRYPQVREYLRKIYLDAVEQWDLDGLKLDFIDEFYEREHTPQVNDSMDCACLQEALDKLLEETVNELKGLKEDILIEFRQRYIGPSIRRYGNILRVGDCPNSGISNRVGITDLRLLSGNTAVHSDMVMWNKQEKPEIAALQIIDCLFGTLQFSVRLREMSEEQREMVQNYMDFMKQHKELLQNTPISAKEPQNLYPEIRTKNEQGEIIALYAKGRVIKIDGKSQKTILVNGTVNENIYVTVENEVSAEVQTFDCFGNLITNENRRFSEIQTLKCKVGGRIEIAPGR